MLGLTAYAALAFTIDLDQSQGLDAMEFIVRLGDKELERYRAIWEDIEGFDLTKAALKRTYGARFKSLTATPAAESVLLGDRMLARLDPF